MMGDVFLAPDRFLSLSFTLVLVAPVTEELLCRGIMLRGLLGRYRPGVAIALSSMLFAFMHLNPWQTISAFALGLLFGWFYLRTGSLWPCIAGHAINNGICVILVSAPFGWWPAPSASDLQIVEFQPLWMDAAGAVLLLAGLRWFGKAAPGIRLDGVPVPPILQPQDLPPVIKT
jgi:hypothetical protein